MSQKILRISEVSKRIGLGKTWIYARIKEDKFPLPVQLGAQAVGWRESDIDQWIADREPVASLKLASAS
jgi:prophage regulatory protein